MVKVLPIPVVLSCLNGEVDLKIRDPEADDHEDEREVESDSAPWTLAGCAAQGSRLSANLKKEDLVEKSSQQDRS